MIKEITLKTLGIGLESFGRMTHKPHLFNLGHYLSGKGDIILDDNVLERIKKFLLYEFNDLDFPNHWIYVNPILMDKELYNALGKFKVKKENSKIFIEDFYVFYPWCGEKNHDSEGCTCSSKSRKWGDVNLLEVSFMSILKFINKINHKLAYKLTNKYFVIGIDLEERRIGSLDNELKQHKVIYFCYYGGLFTIGTIDKLFANLGKPFWQRGEIQL